MHFLYMKVTYICFNYRKNPMEVATWNTWIQGRGTEDRLHSRTPVEFESCPDELIMAGSTKAEGMGTEKGRSISGKGR